MFALVVTMVYSKWFINYPNQLFKMGILQALATLVMLFFAFYMYYFLPLITAIGGEIFVATAHILSYVVVQEEIIKYCSLAHPGTILYATAFLGLGRDMIAPIILSFIGILYDQPLQTWTLVAQLIFTVFSLLYAIFVC